MTQTKDMDYEGYTRGTKGPIQCKSHIEEEIEKPPQEVLTAGEGMETSREKPGTDGIGQTVQSIGVCQFFLLGRCKFGSQCRLTHSSNPVTMAVSESVEGEQNDGHYMKKEGKTKKKKIKEVQKGGAHSKQMESKEPPKKPRMRTAEEVVSRVLWDPSLDPVDFGVGYLDRFLGVLERPFSEFSWDSDVCSCDYTEELALPQHRIQYFTYRGKRIWDRATRKDGIFGSTGGELEPPFGPGKDGRDGTRQDAVLQDLDDTLSAPKKGQTTVSGPSDEKSDAEPGDTYYEKSYHVDGNDQKSSVDGSQQTPKISLTEIPRDTPSDVQITQQAKQNSEGEDATGGMVADHNLDLSILATQLSECNKESQDGRKAEQEEWKECWDEQSLSWNFFPTASHSSKEQQQIAQPEPPEQRAKPKRMRPTHFITFHVNSPTFISAFLRFQKEVTALLPLSAPHWVSPGKLHVTLCLLVLSGPQEVSAAGEILREFVRKHRQPPLSLYFPKKLGNFGGRVLYLTPQPLTHIRSLNKNLAELYKERGWLHRDSFSPRYHLTLAKIVGGGGGKVFEGVDNKVKGVRQVRAVDFGRLVVNKLYLCAINGLKSADGFYDTICTVSLEN